MSDYTPTREDQFSFGLWTVGWQGVDVFGGAVRPPLDPAEAVHKLAELGAYGITFHDNDVFPFDADRRRSGRQRLKPFRAGAGRDRARRPDGDDEPVLAPGVPRRRVHQQRPRRTPVRDPQGRRQHRPRAPSWARKVFVAWGGREGAESGAAKDVASRPRPLQGGLRPPRRSTSSSRATTSGSRSSRSRTSRAATSCCRPSGTRWRSSTSSSTPSWSGSTRRSATRRWPALNYAHGIAQALWHGKLFHIDLNGQNGPRYDQDLRFGAGNARGAFWTVDIVENGGYDGPAALRLQAAAHRGHGRGVGLGRGLHAQLPDPAGEGPRRSAPTPRCSRRSRDARVDQLAQPTLAAGETIATLRAEAFDPEAAAARGMGVRAARPARPGAPLRGPLADWPALFHPIDRTAGHSRRRVVHPIGVFPVMILSVARIAPTVNPRPPRIPSRPVASRSFR